MPMTSTLSDQSRADNAKPLSLSNTRQGLTRPQHEVRIACIQSSSVAIMSNGPVASSLVFLSCLPSLPAGSKVRFLGCVTHYALASGTLALQHAYPPPPAVSAIALVNVTLLLEGLKREDMEVGAWVNVIGYVEDVVRDAGKKLSGKRMVGGGAIGEGATMARVKAIMLWSAGGVKVGEYERVLEDRIRCEKGEAQ